MIDTLEQNPPPNPDYLSPEHAFEASPAIGRIGLSGVEVSAAHFYGGDEQSIGKTPDGEHAIIIGSTAEDGTSKKEAVGVGEDVEAALHNSLVNMRTLETVRTRSLAYIEMTDTAFASFASLEHYSPKVAPSNETYPVPDYLKESLADSEDGSNTYRNTVEKEGWQQELQSVLADYLESDPAGQQLVESLKIRSLSHLTPEQAVKLSAAFVQNVSKYSVEDLDTVDLTRADQSTAVELLKEGIVNKKDPNWKGNGVCRNVASNVKAVFEALKGNQAELSMLNNTYAVYGTGMDGQGYADSRANEYTSDRGDTSGHAWNTFVTLDKKGSAVATIIDATWALGKDAGSALEHLDRTEVRATAQLMQLFEKSDTKTEAFDSLTRYVDRKLRATVTNHQLSESGREAIRGYVTTEYLKAAAQVPEIPEDFTLPYRLMDIASRLSGKLAHEEVEALFTLDKASGGSSQGYLKTIITGYDSERSVSIPVWRSAVNLIFKDNELQTLALDAVGDERIALLSEQSGAFRARLRETRPDTLPPFNALERLEDAQELRHFAEPNGIHDKDPKTIVRRLHDTLKKDAADESVYEAIVAGRTDYDLAKNFTTIIRALRKKAQS